MLHEQLPHVALQSAAMIARGSGETMAASKERRRLFTDSTEHEGNLSLGVQEGVGVIDFNAIGFSSEWIHIARPFAPSPTKGDGDILDENAGVRNGFDYWLLTAHARKTISQHSPRLLLSYSQGKYTLQSRATSERRSHIYFSLLFFFPILF